MYFDKHACARAVHVERYVCVSGRGGGGGHVGRAVLEYRKAALSCAQTVEGSIGQ